MDITSLYTVIPDDEGLRALKHFFDHRTVKEPSSETLLRSAELVLTLNCFSFRAVTTTNKLMAWPWASWPLVSFLIVFTSVNLMPKGHQYKGL